MKEIIERNVTAELSDHAQVRPDAPAIILGDRIMSYAELNEAVWGTVGWLRGVGIRPGAVVGLIIADQISLLLAMLGLMRLGATAFPLSPSAPYSQRESLLRDASAEIFLSDKVFETSEFKSLLFTERQVAVGQRDGMVPSPVPIFPCLLIPGSGSTGRPRLIPISHAVMQERLIITKKYLKFQYSDRLMVVSPPHFSIASRLILTALSSGGVVVLWDQRSRLASTILAMAPDVLHLSVFHAEQILGQEKSLGPVDFSAIRVVSIGASTVNEHLRARMRDQLKARLHIHYGSNEAGTICFATPEDLLISPGAVGRPPERIQVEIVNDAGVPILPRQIGRVRVKSPGQIASYYQELDGDRFRDGWFYPGDLAMWSEDGQLFHCGRADQMMIMNGINIYPAEIERVLEQHPTVRDVVAFPLKHPTAQEIPVCAVVLNSGGISSRGDLSTFARERLGARSPRFIAMLDDIPRNEQGKPKRSELLRLVEEQLATYAEASALRQVATPANKGGLTLSEEVRPRQLSRRINLEFQPPNILQPRAIDAWFAVLNPDLAIPIALPAQPAASVQERGIAEWLNRALLLARELLQLAAIPVFDAPALVACQFPTTQSLNWRAVIALPQVDLVPTRAYQIAFSAAFRAATWMMMHEPSANSRETLFAKLMQDAIEPLKKLASGGKSTMPLLRVAHSRGIPFRCLGGGIYQLGLGAKGRLTDRSTNDRDSAIGTRLALSKPLSAQALRLAGLPAPTHQVVTSAAEARAAAERVGWPVVVKPADRDRGEGVSVDVDAARLDQTFEEAVRLSTSKHVIVERQVEGVCHRLFLASGKLLYAVKRLPMGVYGDGTRSVAALVAAELVAQSRRPPWQRSELSPIDDLARAALKAVGLQETSIPEAGRFVPLRRIESTAWGGIDDEVTDQVHPENLRVAIAAAELFGLDVAGIDIISPDISQPWHANGAIINEVNSAPLLGGGEISRRHIGEYLTRLLEGDGCIPIEVFLGGDAAWDAAVARRKALGGDGAGTFVTSARRTLGGNGHEIPMPLQSLHGRSRALLLSRQVCTLLLVVQNDEWLRTGLPVEYLDSVVDAGGTLRQHQNADLPLSREEEQALRYLLAERVRATAA